MRNDDLNRDGWQTCFPNLSVACLVLFNWSYVEHVLAYRINKKVICRWWRWIAIQALKIKKKNVVIIFIRKCCWWVTINAFFLVDRLNKLHINEPLLKTAFHRTYVQELLILSSQFCKIKRKYESNRLELCHSVNWQVTSKSLKFEVYSWFAI